MAEDWLGKLSGSAKEADARLKEDAAQRAYEATRSGSIILNQKDVLTGKWDASKILFTTIGGDLRPITAEDLAAFRRNITTAQGKFSKGITAKQVIDWSTSADRKRATDEIKTAVPVSGANGRVRFITNAGPDSDVTRHHVVVEFLNYGAESASGSKDARQSALRLRKGPLKFECDCGRHRYWFRYIATIGGFNAGRAETGFPKIRNPQLNGIACKHVLRVMNDIQSGGAVLSFLTRLLDKAKSSDTAKAAIKQAQKEADRLAKNQKRRTAAIKTSDQKRVEKMRKNAADTLKKANKPKKTKGKIDKLSSADAREAALRATMAQFGVEPTAEQIRKVRNAQ